MSTRDRISAYKVVALLKIFISTNLNHIAPHSATLPRVKRLSFLLDNSKDSTSHFRGLNGDYGQYTKFGMLH